MDEVLTQLGSWWTGILQFLSFDPALLLKPDIAVRLFFQVLLLFGSSFFSGSETALFSLSRLDLQKLRRDRHPKFGALQALLEQPRRLIISVLCGNEMINVAATANMAGILVSLYGPARAGVINILIMVPLLLLFGEVTPKTIALSDPVKISTRIIVKPMTLWVKFISPFRWIIRLISDRLTTWIAGQETAPSNILQVDEFRTLVENVVEGGELSAGEKSMIFNLLEAGTREVREIMTPRTQMTFLNGDWGVAEIVQQVRQSRFTRMPVYRQTQDNLAGFVHAEDILRLVMEDRDLSRVSLSDILHPPILVSPTKKVDEMFDFFVDHEAHAAAVLNEFGGIEGFVTMKDVLSFIFGSMEGSG
ncbi:MAG: hemolysin family protein, partial [bacterium]|nr:hemolysin family protein [bacterium]